MEKFEPYFADDICMFINQKVVYEAYVDIMQSDIDRVRLYIRDYSKAVAEDPTFAMTHGGKVVSKSIEFRMRQLQQPFDQPQNGHQYQPTYQHDILTSLVGIFGSMVVGYKFGEWLGGYLGGADMDEVRRLVNER